MNSSAFIATILTVVFFGAVFLVGYKKDGDVLDGFMAMYISAMVVCILVLIYILWTVILL